MIYKDDQNNTYNICWTDSINEEMRNHFINICNEVFGKATMTRERYLCKFSYNIYGPSIIVIVYNEKGVPIAARSFWRNDINGQIAYQLGDTCVVKEARGMGIFRKMTKYALNEINSSSIIYNYPNQNSLNGYLKMGWRIVGEYRLKFVFLKSRLRQAFDTLIDNEYAKWWLLFDEKGIKSYFKYGGRTYLVNKKRYYGTIIGQISNNINVSDLPVYKGLLFYRASDIRFYNKKKRPITIVMNSNFNNEVVVPIHKMDALS